MKKTLALMLALTMIFTFCAGGAFADAPEASGEVVRVGTMCNAIGLPIYYAMEKGFFEEAGLEIELFLFPTGAPINEALAAGELDVANSGMASVYSLSFGNSYWLGDIINSSDGLGVYVREGSPLLTAGHAEGNEKVLGSVETVKGITILGTAGTSDQFNADKYVGQFGLTANDYEFLNMERGPAVQAYIAGEGDAVICGDTTFKSQLEGAGCIQVGSMFDCAGIGIYDGILATKEFVDSRPGDAELYTQCIYRAIEELIADEQARYDVGMKWYEENARGYTDADMKAEIAAKRYVGRDTITSAEYTCGSTMIGMGEFYVSTGKIEPDLQPNISAAIITDYVSEIYGVEVVPCTLS